MPQPGEQIDPVGRSNARQPAKRARRHHPASVPRRSSERAATNRAAAGGPDRETRRLPVPAYTPTANRAVAKADGCLAPLTPRRRPRAGDRVWASSRCRALARRARANLPHAGWINVARTCVLIKKTSHQHCTCVLIICMSQASHGRWPGSDDTSKCRQNGVKCSYLAMPGTAQRLARRGNRPRGRPRGGAGGGRHEPGVRPAVRTGGATPRSRRPRSLPKAGIRPGRGQRVAAGRAPGRGRPPPARPAKADDPNHFPCG
jgi:hypothetical protein